MTNPVTSRVWQVDSLWRGETIQRPRGLPGLVLLVSSGRSSSQSVMSSCLWAMLRKCFPPFTFHVPMAILALAGTVYSGCSRIIDLRISGCAVERRKLSVPKWRTTGTIRGLWFYVAFGGWDWMGFALVWCGSDSQCKLEVESRALALSDSSPRSVLPSNKMSIASCLLLSMKLFWMVRVADRAASPACWSRQKEQITNGSRFARNDKSKWFCWQILQNGRGTGKREQNSPGQATRTHKTSNKGNFVGLMMIAFDKASV